MEKTFPQFFMVMSEKTERPPPVVRHDDVDRAKAEAKRLATANPGEAFYVLHCIGKMQAVDPVKWIESDELPF